MEILKSAVDWAKAEMLSSSFFVLFGLSFLAGGLGFYYLGKTEIARAYIIPLFVAGALVLIIGLGIFFQSYARVSSFPLAFNADAAGFIEAQLQDANKVLGQYRTAIFLVIPLIIAASAVLMIVLDGPMWRASFVTTIAMMSVLLLVDTNANARLEAFKTKLIEARETENRSN